MTVENTTLPAHQPSSQAAPDADDEFDAAMAEATADESAPASAAADSHSDGPGNGTDEPPVPAGKAATQAPPAANAPSGNPDNSDIWANAPAELRAAYEQDRRDAELRLKSVQGRQSAADRELQRLRQEHADLQRRLQTNAGGEQGQGGSTSGEPADDPYKQLVEDYPEIAGPLVEKLKELQGTLNQVQQGVGTFQQERELIFYKQQQDLLTEKQPDWLNVLGDDRFGGWLEEQPTPVKEAFERNRQAIVDGSEAAWLVGQFKTALGIGAQPQQQQPPSQEASRRAKQLASGRDFSGGSGAPVADGIPDDFDAAMNAFADQEDAKTRRR